MTSLSPKHLLTFYGNTASLLEGAGAYLAEGARNGESLVIIATSSHLDAFQRRLAELHVDLPRLRADGRLLTREADATLARFMIDDRPDPGRFEDVVAALVRETVGRDGGRGTRVYGEMVDLLWRSGRLVAATELEGLWNRLLKSLKFSLFCSYAIDLLAPGTSMASIQALLSAHSHLLPAGRDGELLRAVDAAMRETLGAPSVELLAPLIRATRHARSVEPGAEATIFWLRKHFPGLADEVLARARVRYQAECDARNSGLP